MNDEGDKFVIFGICWGFQSLHYYQEPTAAYMVGPLNSNDYSNNHEFITDPSETKLFGDASEQLIKSTEEGRTLYEFHNWGVGLSAYDNYPTLAENLTPISIAYDLDGTGYVQTVEHKEYPFFGTQFHPEYPMFRRAAKYNDLNTS